MNTAQRASAANVTPSDLTKWRAKWNADYAVYDFPDGSSGSYASTTSLPDACGDAVLKFRECEKEVRL